MTVQSHESAEEGMLPLKITFDQAAYDRERTRRREICANAGHQPMQRGESSAKVCVRCLEPVT